MSLRFGFLISVATVVLTVVVSAQTAPANDDCLTCHGDPDMKRANGQPVTVPKEAFEHSVHGPFSCVDCHVDLAKVTEFPHAEHLAPVNCAMCHDEPAMQLAGSVHVRRPHGGGEPIGCTGCHGPPHRILPAQDPESATNKLKIAETCGRCHGDASAPAGQRASSEQGPAVARMFADSIHGQALSRAGLVVAPTCSDCHRSHAVVEKTSTESPVYRLNVPATCGKCHAGIAHDYSEGIHAVALKAGDPRAPQCASCHTAHAISRTTSSEWQLSAVQQCGTCHAEALSTYRDTFHGQVTRLGFEPVAKCADCHQSHRLFAANDRRSSVHPANLVGTCGQCHTQANANFIKYQPHANKHNAAKLPQLYYAGRFMDALLIGTFAFFGLHTTLWFMRERTGPADPDERQPDSPAGEPPNDAGGASRG